MHHHRQTTLTIILLLYLRLRTQRLMRKHDDAYADLGRVNHDTMTPRLKMQTADADGNKEEPKERRRKAREAPAMAGPVNEIQASSRTFYPELLPEDGGARSKVAHEDR